jgi:hypothetical protein
MNVIARRLVVAGLATLALPTLAAAAGLHVSTGQLYYDVGDTVRFTVRNDHDENVYMPSFPYWSITEEATGLIGASCTGLPTVHSIAPGVSESHTWTQIMCETGDPAAPGLYRLRVDYWLDSSPDVDRTGSTLFCIGAECDIPTGIGDGVVASSWGQVRALFR